MERHHSLIYASRRSLLQIVTMHTTTDSDPNLNIAFRICNVHFNHWQTQCEAYRYWETIARLTSTHDNDAPLKHALRVHRNRAVYSPRDFTSYIILLGWLIFNSVYCTVRRHDDVLVTRASSRLKCTICLWLQHSKQNSDFTQRFNA